MSDAKRSPHVFGPVPSRRLGRSLGVDLTPFKTCTFDCIYCQLGHTTHKTLERAEYVPTDEVLADVRERLASGVAADYVTLSASGDPTLHSRLAEIVAGIKAATDIPLAVLTNGSLFWDPAVRDACLPADLIVPSLDAGGEPAFQQMNRPAEGLTLARVVEGLVRLREAFDGVIWLEVFFAAGVNDSDDEVERIGALAERIRPDRIQLNTAVRPPVEASVRALTREQLERIARRLGPTAEVVADFQSAPGQDDFEATGDEVLALLRHRPCTLADVAGGLGIHQNEAVKYLERLTSSGQASTTVRDGRTYYQA